MRHRGHNDTEATMTSSVIMRYLDVSAAGQRVMGGRSTRSLTRTHNTTHETTYETTLETIQETTHHG